MAENINVYGVLHNDTPENVVFQSEQVAIDPIEGLESTNVQDALEELVSEIGEGGEGEGNSFSYDENNEEIIVSGVSEILPDSSSIEIVSTNPELPTSEKIHELSIEFNRDILEADLIGATLSVEIEKIVNGIPTTTISNCILNNGSIISTNSTIGSYSLDGTFLYVEFPVIGEGYKVWGFNLQSVGVSDLDHNNIH